MSIWAAIFLGLLQGIAEFLPISSSGHLSVLQNLFELGTGEEGHLFFDVLLHFGTLVAICVAYWSSIKEMVFDVLAFVQNRKQPAIEQQRRYPAGRLALMLIFGTLPLLLVLPVNDYIEQLYYNTFFIGAAFLLTGCMLYVSDRMPQGRRQEKGMRVRDALIIGLCQAVATIPGLSRSGATITAGLATGLERNFALKYSLLLSLPAVLGANLLALIRAVKAGIDVTLLPAYFVGMLVAGASGYFAIRILRRIVQRDGFGKFSYYCWGVGLVTIILSIVFTV